MRKDLKKRAGNFEVTDYYLEGGMVVFTEYYHLKRGYCCKSGCRHCPYDTKEKIFKK